MDCSSPPRLALVLSGGGVRSIAAIGIAEVLADQGLRPDLIVGCSSEALFGATLAMGMTSRESLQAATTLWSAELTQQHRWPADAQLVAPKLFRFDAGFSDRQRVRRPAAGGWRTIPYRFGSSPPMPGAASAECFARVPWRRRVRASVAVPLVFPSVEVDGRRLVDGVVSDPLPISVASDAAVVVALGFKGTMPRRIDRVSRMVAQASTAIINNLQQARIDAARNAG